MNKEVKQTIFVNAIIHDAQQRALVLRRSLNDKFLPGYLELPGGRAELGETLEHALKRKLLSELNIVAKEPLYYISLADINSKGPYVRTTFEVALDNNEKIQLSGAHDEYMWLNQRDISHHKLTADTKTILRSYLGTAFPEKSDEKNTAFTIYTDGGSRGNPGPSASAYVIYSRDGKIIESGGQYIGIATNNRAEYTAVLLALKAVANFGDSRSKLQFNIDSLLVVNQMNGIYKIKNRDLWPLNQEIRQLIKDFQEVRFVHVPREQNVVADAKVNEILDAHAGAGTSY